MRTGLVFITVFFSLYAKTQHTPLTTQYMFNNLVINPAYTGAMNAFTCSASHRSQWLGLNGAPETQNFTVHGPLRNENIALGLLLFRDVIGVTAQNGAFLSYAYRIKMNKSRLCFGLAGGASFLKSSYNQVVTVTANDPSFTGHSPTYVLPNASFGIYFYNKLLFTGLSLPYFITNKIIGGSSQVEYGYDNFNLHAQLGLYLKFGPNFTLKPSTLIKVNVRKAPQTDLNLLALFWNKLGLGISWRIDDAIIIPAQIHVNDQFMIGYSYDMTISALKSYQFGSHELFIRYCFLKTVNAANPRFF
ncbi:MAG TPA: PorP/SprF family type IX secretion system membrane protein [Flavobacteriales bacterium]|nr:PorP/SprF family type IX secretion system membrane protein [Flavobacteriales bacterium]